MFLTSAHRALPYAERHKAVGLELFAFLLFPFHFYPSTFTLLPPYSLPLASVSPPLIHFLVILFIFAGSDVVHPGLVVEVPADGALDAFLELEAGLPTQLALQLGTVDGIAQVVPGAVGHIGDEVHILPFLAPKQPVHRLNHHPDEVDVLPLVEAADVVRVGHLALMENEVDGAGVVFHIQPVAHILALAIDGQRLAVADIVDEQRYQLLGELVRTVVVRAVGHDGGHTVGVMESPHEMVGRGLRGTVGTMGIVLGVLIEKVLAIGQVVHRRGSRGGKRRLDTLGMGKLQRTIHFIGGDVVEAFAFIPLGQALPIQLGGLQQRQRTEHIGAGKGKRVLDAAIHMAFGSQMDDAVHPVLLHELAHAVEVANVGLDKGVVRPVFHILQIGQIACISQLVHVDDVIIGILVDKQPHHMRPDETGPAGDDDVTSVCIHNAEI